MFLGGEAAATGKYYPSPGRLQGSHAPPARSPSVATATSATTAFSHVSDADQAQTISLRASAPAQSTNIAMSQARRQLG